MNREQARAWAIDVAERTGATALEAAAGYGLTVVGDLPAWAAVPITIGLTVVKGWAARFVGDKGSASVLPAAPASERSG